MKRLLYVRNLFCSDFNFIIGNSGFRVNRFVERGYKEKTLDAIFGNSAMIRSRHYDMFVRIRRNR